jgi:hypothetical protein
VDIRQEKETRMLRKSILAFTAVAALGTAALTPTTADAHWYGGGWYGYGKPYYHSFGWDWKYRYPYGFYGPRHVFGWKKLYKRYSYY